MRTKKADPRQQELPKQKMISFKGGLKTIPELVHSKLGNRLQLNATVNSIQKLPNSYQISYSQNGQSHQLEVDYIISSLPAYAEANLWNNSYGNFSEELKKYIMLLLFPFI